MDQQLVGETQDSAQHRRVHTAITWADELKELPTLSVGQAADLKIDVGRLRVWLARTGIEGGEPFERAVYIELRNPDGRWVEVGCINGDDEELIAASEWAG